MCHSLPSAAEKQTAGIPSPAHSDTVCSRGTSSPSTFTKEKSKRGAWELFHRIDLHRNEYTMGAQWHLLLRQKSNSGIQRQTGFTKRNGLWFQGVLLDSSWLLQLSELEDLPGLHQPSSQPLCPTSTLDPSHALLSPIPTSVWSSQKHKHTQQGDPCLSTRGLTALLGS